MQILREGQLRDSMARRADFRNAIVVLTAPAPPPAPAPGTSASGGASGGAEVGPPGGPHGSASKPRRGGQGGEAKEGKAWGGARQPKGAHGMAAAAAVEEGEGRSDAAGSTRPVPAITLPPDILGLMDSVVHFRPLGKPEMLQIVQRGVAACGEALGEHGVVLQVGSGAEAWLAERARWGSGARRVEGLLRSEVLAPIAELLLERAALPEAAGGGEEGGVEAWGGASSGKALIVVEVGKDGSGLSISCWGEEGR